MDEQIYGREEEVKRGSERRKKVRKGEQIGRDKEGWIDGCLDGKQDEQLNESRKEGRKDKWINGMKGRKKYKYMVGSMWKYEKEEERKEERGKEKKEEGSKGGKEEWREGGRKGRKEILIWLKRRFRDDLFRILFWKLYVFRRIRYGRFFLLRIVFQVLINIFYVRLVKGLEKCSLFYDKELGLCRQLNWIFGILKLIFKG